MSSSAKSSGLTALTTGGSGGIGLELAKQFAAHGHDLVLTARHRDALEAVAGTIEGKDGVAIDEAIGAFVRSVYTRSSVSTHTPTDKREVMRILDLVRVVLGELLEAQ